MCNLDDEKYRDDNYEDTEELCPLSVLMDMRRWYMDGLSTCDIVKRLVVTVDDPRHTKIIRLFMKAYKVRIVYLKPLVGWHYFGFGKASDEGVNERIGGRIEFTKNEWIPLLEEYEKVTESGIN